LLLARAVLVHADSRSLEAWLADAFQLAEDPLPAGAITVQAEHSDLQDRAALWLRAGPRASAARTRPRGADSRDRLQPFTGRSDGVRRPRSMGISAPGIFS
jgi:hypothetical protein